MCAPVCFRASVSLTSRLTSYVSCMLLLYNDRHGVVYDPVVQTCIFD